MACRPRLVGGGGGGRMTGSCVLGAFFELPPLFLLANRPFKSGLFFRSISFSSSLDSKSIQAMTNYFGWMEESLVDSVLESKISIGFSVPRLPRSEINLFPPLGIAENVIFSSAAIVASKGTCCNGITSGWGIWWIGSLTGGRSSQAKKFGLDTSIRFIRGSPTLIAWPISWKTFKIGSKYKIKWLARNCRSSLTKIFDRST